MKLLTLEDYQKAGETFFPKYWYVAKELGEGAKPEDIIKVMEANEKANDRMVAVNKLRFSS